MRGTLPVGYRQGKEGLWVAHFIQSVIARVVGRTGALFCERNRGNIALSLRGLKDAYSALLFSLFLACGLRPALVQGEQRLVQFHERDASLRTRGAFFFLFAFVGGEFSVDHMSNTGQNFFCESESQKIWFSPLYGSISKRGHCFSQSLLSLHFASCQAYGEK